MIHLELPDSDVSSYAGQVRDAFGMGPISPQSLADPRADYTQMIAWEKYSWFALSTGG